MSLLTSSLYKVLEENEKISEIERIIDTAQIEELIEMAQVRVSGPFGVEFVTFFFQDELALIPFMNQHRFW